MTHKERIQAAIEHRSLDRIPTDFWATEEVQEKLCDYFGIEEGKDSWSPWIGLNGGLLSRGVAGITAMLDRLHADAIFDVHPPYIGPALGKKRGVALNEWGFGYQKKQHATGSYMEQVIFPLSKAKTVEDIRSFQWPDPDWYDYDSLPELIEQCGERAVNVGYSAVFTFHNYLRGLETSLMDPIINPEMTQELISQLELFFMEYHTRCFEAAGNYIDVSQVTDDWGNQNGLMVSPQTFRQFYKQSMQKAIDLVHQYNIAVFHHDDGDCRVLVPEFVEMGIDILNPIQYRCGNWNLEQLKLDYGKNICFHSGVDNQEILPLGSPQDVSAEVTQLIQTLAHDGTGFIVGPCHNLQPNTSVENVLALYRTAKEYGAE
jgi:uroporphyrinogen decarboxylase